VSELLSSTSAGRSAEAGRADVAHQQSLLFPSLFGKLDRGRRIQILDIGPAFPETLDFFSACRCRLHFAGLYEEEVVLQGSGERERPELVELFRELLAVPEKRRFDLVLLWDLPNYLDDEALSAFSEALAPHLHPRTLGHGFAVRTQDTRLSPRWYGIKDKHLFTVRKPWTPQPRFNPHSQAILINMLTCFSIDRGMLLPDGRLEVAMKVNS
jgi:hypothetical protein